MPENMNITTTDNAVDVPMQPEIQVEEVTEEVKPAPKKKRNSPSKAKQPSDKTIIKNLRKEVRDLTAKVEQSEVDIITQEDKAKYYFNKYNEVIQAKHHNQAAEGEALAILKQTIGMALQSYDMVKRGGK